MRKLHTLFGIMVSFPILSNAQTSPLYFKELEKNGYTFSNPQEIEVFFEWLASPTVQHCCQFLMAICFFYIATALLLHALIIYEVLPSRTWMLNWLTERYQAKLVTVKAFLKKTFTVVSREKKVTENETEKAILYNKKQPIRNLMS